MGINFLALVLAVGAVGEKAPASKLPPPATAANLQLEKAARDCRIQIYETFHKDRAEYDRRQAEAARIQAAWSEAGGSEGDRPKLLAWFELATAHSRSASIADLPPLPTFTIVPQSERHEKKLVESTTADSAEDAAATTDRLLHVKPAAATNLLSSSPSALTPQSKASVIGSLPQAFESEVVRTLHGVSGELAPSPTKKNR